MPCVNSNDTTESSDSQAQENNENPVIKNEEVKKVNRQDSPRQLKLHVLQHKVAELSSSVSFRWSQVRTRPLMPRQKRRLSNDVAGHPKRLLLLRRRQKKKEEWHQQGVEPAGEGRERPTQTQRQSRTPRCQNSSSKMTKDQRDRLICKGELIVGQR